MHSGGGTKEPPYEKIYIEAEEEEARVIFYNKFGHSADRISCTCCGADYSVSHEYSLDQLTAFHRNCDYDQATELYVERVKPSRGKYQSPEEYAARDDVLIIPAVGITDSERKGGVPTEGWVWR